MSDFQAYDDRVEYLRERLDHHAKNVPSLLDQLEHDVKSGALGKIAQHPYVQVISDYENDARNLLRLVPDDAAGSKALEDVALLRKRLVDLN